MMSLLPGSRIPARWWRTWQRWVLAWSRIVYLGAVVLVLVLSPSTYSPAARRTMSSWPSVMGSKVPG